MTESFFARIDVPPHLSPILEKTRPGSFFQVVVVYSIEKYQFIPKDSDSEISRCSLVLSDHSFKKTDKKIGFSFRKQSLPLNFFSIFDKIPCVCVFELKLSSNQKYGPKLVRFYT